MSIWRVLITQPILDAGLECFYQQDLKPEIGHFLAQSTLLEMATQYHAIVTMVSNKLTKDFFQAAQNGPLKIVANHAVGYDNIDLQAAQEAGIWITNTPDVLTKATAELAWALVFATSRRIGEGERLVRTGRWKGWEPTQLIGQDIYGKTLGILGAGRIGQAFAKMGQGFQLKILYHNRKRDQKFEEECSATYCSLDELLKLADIVSIHLPSTPSTKHLLSARELDLMKPTAILVNTGRGNILDEAALIQVLKENKIAGAGLDVYEHEPTIGLDLLNLENVVLAPHIGSASVQARVGMARLCAENIAAALKGDIPPNALAPSTTTPD